MPGELLRLAQLLTIKHQLQSEAASLEEIVNRIRQDLINAYTLYVNADKAKDPVLQMLANAGEPFSKLIVSEMEEIVAGIDTLSAVQLFNRVNKLLGNIQKMKDGMGSVRKLIHDSIRGSKESERNYREHLKSKLETILHRLSGILVKQAKLLQPLLPKDVELEGGRAAPQRKELSKEKLLVFMKTPAAQKYGLDNLDTMTRLLSYPDVRQKITTLIGAIDRGHIPLDGPEVATIARELRDIYDSRGASNAPFFEGSEDQAQKSLNTELLTPSEQAQITEDEKAKALERERVRQERANQEADRLAPQQMQRDMEYFQRQDDAKQQGIEDDRDRLIKKYESAFSSMSNKRT